MADKLANGGVFPTLQLQTTGGASISLPNDISTPYAIVLFYRGHW